MSSPVKINDNSTSASCLNEELGPSSSRRNAWKCVCVSKLLKEIQKLREKQLTLAKAFGAENIPANFNETNWALLFVEYILDHVHCSIKDCSAHHDDMLWYVPLVKTNSSLYIGSGTSHLQVFRRQSRNKPIPGDKNVNWEETVCLNVILQQMDYFVSCAVCTKTSPNNLQIIRKNCQRVYPSPSKRRMDAKGECEEITYPKIYFAVDNFDQVFNDVIVTEGECVCVELVARDRYRDKETVIFLGSIRYDVLKKLYDSRNTGTWNWAQKLISTEKRRFEFVRMRGPHGRGFAEMAIARVASCGFDTPMSENGFEIINREEVDSPGQRRMSDTNVFNKFAYKRGAMTPGPGPSSGSNTLPLSARSRRWTSGSEHGDSDFEGDTASVMSSASNTSTWSMKGIGQALNWLKEKKEATPLNAYLTYITLPWTSILEDMIMSTNRRPILTFDLDYLEHDITNRNV